MTDWLIFHSRVFWQPFQMGILDHRLQNSEFRLQVSEIRSPHWAFALLYRYIFVCKMEIHSEGQVNTWTCLSVGWMLYHCLRHRPNIKTTLNRCFVLAYTLVQVLAQALPHSHACASTCVSICALTHLRKYLLKHLRKYLRPNALIQLLAHVPTCASTCTFAYTCAITHLSKYLRTCVRTPLRK